MKRLSLWEPWASLLATGWKKIETRSWPFPGRLPGVLAVHAAKRFLPEQRLLCEKEPFAKRLRAIGWYERPIPLGRVVGLVKVVACYSTTGSTTGGPWRGLLTDEERAFGDYSPGRYGWVCDRYRPLPDPLPLRGFQGVWEWAAPAEVEALGRELLREVGHAGAAAATGR